MKSVSLFVYPNACVKLQVLICRSEWIGEVFPINRRRQQIKGSTCKNCSNKYFKIKTTEIGKAVEARHRFKGRECFKTNFYLTLPSFNRLTNFNKLCTKRVYEK